MPTPITDEEAAALVKILDEVDYIGYGEFARLTENEEGAVRSAHRKLAEMKLNRAAEGQ